jgi:nuclear pore complex protein Nup98-Nup96
LYSPSYKIGSTPATSQATPGFGATGASPFGQQPQQQQQQQQSVGGLFGQAAQSTPSFGQQATGGGFGGFGQKPAAQATTGFGGFGATNANKPATSFNFGSAAPPATSTAATAGFGGFGANTGAAGFGSTGVASGGLFGASKPAATTGLFGAAPQGSTFGGFGATNNTGLGSGLFGAKPATNNATAPSLFGNTQQTTGGFGFGNQQANNANTFSLPGTGGMTTFGTTGLQQQPNANQQPPLYASLDKYPYGYNPLFENLPAGTSGAERSSSVAVSEEPSKKLSTTPHFMITPRSATKIKLRGYSFAPTGELVSRKKGGLDGISDDAVLRPEAFAPRPSIKRLIINKKMSPSELSAATNGGTGVLSAGSKAKVTFDPHLELIASQDHDDHKAGETADGEQQANTSETSKPTNRNTAFSDNAMAQGYYIKPSLQVLGNQSRQQLKNTQHLVVGLKGVGEITFEGPVDLSEIDLDQIMVGIVNFQPKTCTVYPDEDAKPPQGKGLNVPATIKLEKCYPVDKTTRQPITDSQHPRVIAIIRKLRAVPETEFIDFDASTGTWTFKVQHF